MAVPCNIRMTSPISFDNDDRQIDSSLVDYVDILFNLMGVDITYREFQNMTEGERKQFVRDLKIKKVIKEL